MPRVSRFVLLLGFAFMASTSLAFAKDSVTIGMVLEPPALDPTSAPAAAADPILVIDDSLTTRMLETSILESAGFAVEQAMSGEEGLEKARRGAYSLFLVDVEMPGIDGFTFVERTRGTSKMSKAIVCEALWRVTCWAVAGRSRRRSGRR